MDILYKGDAGRPEPHSWAQQKASACGVGVGKVGGQVEKCAGVNPGRESKNGTHERNFMMSPNLQVNRKERRSRLR